jgi:hypothetical protein
MNRCAAVVSFDHDQKSTKIAQRASQTVPRASEVALIQSGKSARLILALDDDLTTKPTISGQKSTDADSVKTGARILCFA